MRGDRKRGRFPFDRRITLIRKAPSSDAVFGAAVQETTEYQVRATAYDSTDREGISGGAETASRVVTYWIRGEAWPGEESQNPRFWAIRDRGQTLDVEGIERSNDRGRFLKITAVARR